MSTKFEFTISTKRWGHKDTYEITRTNAGWHVRHMSYDGEGNKRGEPVLFQAMDQDVVSYPAALGDHLEHLWEQAEQGNASETEVQGALNKIADWVSACERAAPPYFVDSKKG